MRILFVSVSFIFLSSPAEAADTQPYPARPVRLIVPYAPGGGADTLARYVSQALGESLSQSFVIDNRGGGGTLLGCELAAKATPDGYTLLMVASTHAVISSLYKSLPFDPIRDFTAIVRVASAPNILVVHPSLGVGSIKELVKLGKGNPGGIVYASSGNGGGSHLAMELFRSMAHIDLIHVPYKGTGPAMIDLLSGQAKMMFGGMIGTVTHTRSGRLKTIAVSSASRSALMPEVPTVAESGFPDYEASTWYGLLGPAAMPPNRVKFLNMQVRDLLKGPKLQAKILAQGADLTVSSAEDFSSYIKSEQIKWAKVVKDSGAKPE